MAEFKRPTTQEEFDKNFKLKKPLMNDTEAFYESSRCLFCYDAPCVQACPTSIDIPLFIKQISTKNVEGAAKTIYDANWLGNACGTVCPTDVLCVGSCVYNHQDVKPLQIGRLQNYATKNVINSGKQLYKPGKDNGKKVAIIGSGPAGIACASELRLLGFEVTIYEAKEKPSGLTVYGIAPYKITNEDVLDEVEYLQKQLGFTIKYNSPISNKAQLELLERTHDAIFLGLGIGATAGLNMEGENLENVIGAVEFVEDLRMQHHLIEVPKKVIVLGGGNTAMDAASETARLGAEKVYLAYRRAKEDMGAYSFEYDLAVSAGVEGLFNCSPIEIVGNGTKVTGVKFIRTSTEHGILRPLNNTEFVLECDMVIKATGQAKQKKFTDLISDLELDRKSRIVVDEKNNQTTNPKYFAGGDVINGGAEVVNAVYDGKLAAKGIHQWLTK
ncbi:NAD(P)-dependent oxidoreductase [Cellulophaga baltica]|uniref:NAD(P)-dependent oxidoreductase n=1 Tax=Cellulophaga TaxID=104264 RepID=UPI001C0700BE|nr:MULTISPECIES: NAD(P)-dependent oxidoreductase [Cellulophaga]MBU2996668.1 NAD(P)-dependent oxidoreductase [Cellulophaga baltica]MDO6768062.1 NAD(P)-dependent oxidoreductase [Cellulophaga sp. 1_MG-2023]